MSHSDKTEVISSSKSGTSMDDGHCDCPINTYFPNFPSPKNEKKNHSDKTTESPSAEKSFFNVGMTLKNNLLKNIENEISKVDLVHFYNDVLMERSCDMHRELLKDLLLLHIIKASLLSSLTNKSMLQMFYDMTLKRPDLFSCKYMILYVLTVITNLDFTNYAEGMYS